MNVSQQFLLVRHDDFEPRQRHDMKDVVGQGDEPDEPAREGEKHHDEAVGQQLSADSDPKTPCPQPPTTPDSSICPLHCFWYVRAGRFDNVIIRRRMPACSPDAVERRSGFDRRSATPLPNRVNRINVTSSTQQEPIDPARIERSEIRDASSLLSAASRSSRRAIRATPESTSGPAGSGSASL